MFSLHRVLHRVSRPFCFVRTVASPAMTPFPIRRQNLTLFVTHSRICAAGFLFYCTISDGKRALDNTLRPLPLTPREYDPLAFLVTHRGKFFGRDRLLDLVWGIHFEGGERTVDIHIRRLRAKLPPQTADRLQTRCGTGYGFEV
jgi:DNA-binding response OmpR family regulator